MKKFPLFPFVAQMVLCLLSCLVLFGTSALADAPGKPAPERKPKLLERIGNFFYNVADRLERSDIPDSPGRYQPGAGRPRPPMRDKQTRGEAMEDAARNRYIAPVNPDPLLLQPPKPSTTKYLDALPGDGDSGPSLRPTAPPDSLKPVPLPIKPMAPLPDSGASARNRKPAESTGADASSQPKKGGEVSGAAKTEKIIHPTATRTNRLGRVKSPYPPYAELDVTGLPSGSLAKDPGTGQIFRLP